MAKKNRSAWKLASLAISRIAAATLSAPTSFASTPAETPPSVLEGGGRFSGVPLCLFERRCFLGVQHAVVTCGDFGNEGSSAFTHHQLSASPLLPAHGSPIKVKLQRILLPQPGMTSARPLKNLFLETIAALKGS